MAAHCNHLEHLKLQTEKFDPRREYSASELGFMKLIFFFSLLSLNLLMGSRGSDDQQVSDPLLDRMKFSFSFFRH